MMTELRRAGVAYLYLLSFLEGGSVMICEIVGARMLAPYFGTSLYVWAGALGITLGGLMTGYYLGGLVSRRVRDNQKALYLILIAAALCLFLMPFTGAPVMQAALKLSLQSGTVVSLSVFMLPPLVFMGMVSPLIINLLTHDAGVAGNKAGNVYAISTLGGILATFLFGFYIIPEFGITRPAMISGVTLGLLPVISLVRRYRSYTVMVLYFVICIACIVSLPAAGEKGMFIEQYRSEGILGQVKVVDFTDHTSGRELRALVVNNTLQTVIDRNDPAYDYWPYTALVAHLAAGYPAGSNALLLGMGAGTLVNRLEPLDFALQVVELDSRIRDVAVTYFGLSPIQDVAVDDARHFVRVSRDTFDVIIYDVFKGEEAPVHVLTTEALAEARDVLAPGGMIILNFYGYLDGTLGMITRSVVRTLEHAGFRVQLYATPGRPDERNIVMVARATDGLVDPAMADRRLPLAYEPEMLHIPEDADFVVLTDEKPQLRLFASAALQWRKLYNAYFMPH